MKAGNYPKAFQSLRRLRNTDLQAARDLFFIHAELKDELEAQERARANQKGGGYFSRLFELFTDKTRNRPATIAAFTVMIAQQMCGSKPVPPGKSKLNTVLTDGQSIS